MNKSIKEHIEVHMNYTYTMIVKRCHKKEKEKKKDNIIVLSQKNSTNK